MALFKLGKTNMQMLAVYQLNPPSSYYCLRPSGIVQRPPLMTHPILQWLGSKLVETQAGLLDGTEVSRLLNGTGSRTRANLVKKS